MRYLFLLVLLALPQTVGALPQVVIQTTLGDIVVELEAERAPKTVANFLAYVDRGLYTNARFHRTTTLKPDNQPQNDVTLPRINFGTNHGVMAPSRQGASESIIPGVFERGATQYRRMP